MIPQIFDKELNVQYFDEYYIKDVADQIYSELLGYNFVSVMVDAGEKHYSPNQESCAFGDPAIRYAFSGTCVRVQPWTSTLQQMKKDMEQLTGDRYNYAVLNLCPDGTAKIEAPVVNDSCYNLLVSIPCLSFGITRSIEFTRDGCPRHTMELEHGSVLLLHPPSEQCWKLTIPAEPKRKCPRLSVTFRNIIEPAAKRPHANAEPSSKKVEVDELPEEDWLTEYMRSLN